MATQLASKTQLVHLVDMQGRQADVYQAALTSMREEARLATAAALKKAADASAAKGARGRKKAKGQDRSVRALGKQGGWLGDCLDVEVTSV